MKRGRSLKDILFRHESILILAFLITAGFLLRINRLNEEFVFLYDQGRDAQVVKQIIEEKKLTLLGPPMTAEGAYYGPFYYYFLLVGYSIGGGNPLFVMYLVILLNMFSIIFIYYVVKKYINRIASYVAVFLNVFCSYLVISSRTLSNPALIPMLAVLYYYLLIRSFLKNSKTLLLAGVVLGLIIQLEFPVAIQYFFVFVVYIFSVKSIREKIKSLVFFSFGFFIAILPQVVFEVRHDFLTSRSLMRFVLERDAFEKFNLFILKNNLMSLENEIGRIIMPSLAYVGLAIYLLQICLGFIKVFGSQSKKDLIVFRLLLANLLFIPLVLLFTDWGFEHLFLIGTAPFCLMFLAFYLSNLYKRSKGLLYVLMLSFMVLNLFYLKKNENFNNFVPNGNKITYGQQKEVIDYIYKQAEGGDFYYEAYTVPNWLPDVWEYLFSWYGFRTYGYIPKKESMDTFYLIIEKDYDHPKLLDDWLCVKGESSYKVVEKKISDTLMVEERKKNE